MLLHIVRVLLSTFSNAQTLFVTNRLK